MKLLTMNIWTNVIRQFSIGMGNYKKVSHVIFDMDGIILDTETIYKKTFSRISSQFGKEYSNELRLKVLGTVERETCKIIVDTLQLPLSAEEFCDQAKALNIDMMPEAELMPGVERLIRHFHECNVPIAIATSSSLTSMNNKIKRHKELFQLFHHIVVGGSDPEVKRGKPHPDVFLIAASRFHDKPSPEKCLVIEDSPNGVRAAKLAGMQVVMVPEDYVPDTLRKDATLVINSLLNFDPSNFGLPELAK